MNVFLVVVDTKRIIVLAISQVEKDVMLIKIVQMFTCYFQANMLIKDMYEQYRFLT